MYTERVCVHQLSVALLTFTVLAFCLVEFYSEALIPKTCPVVNTLSCFPGGILTVWGNACKICSCDILQAQITFLNI